MQPMPPTYPAQPPHAMPPQPPHGVPPQPPHGTPRKQPNKALLVLAIGCGSVFILSAIVGVAALFWLKGRVSDAIGGFEQVAAQEERLKSLDEKYPFTPPAEGKPLRLEEKRLQEYLAVRSALVPVFQGFQAKAKDFEARHGDKQGLGAGLEAIGMTGELIREVRDRFAKELDARRMSPKEFHAITGTIYASYLGAGMSQVQEGQREVLEKMLKTFDEQLADKKLPAQAREMITKQREQVAMQLAELPKHAISPEDKAIYEANTALLEKYKAQIEKEANPGLDALLFGDRSGLENAFQPLGITKKPSK